MRTGGPDRRRAATAAVALVALALTGGCAATGAEPASDDGQALDLEQPERLAFASEVSYFEDLATMLASSDAVVVGEVTDVRAGRVVGEADFSIRFREVDVRVEHDERDRFAAGDTVLVEQEGWSEDVTGDESSYAYEGQGWLQEGTKVLLFLVDKGGPEAGRYRAISSQGLYEIAGDVVAPVPAPEASHAPLVAEIAAMAAPEVKIAVATAGRGVRSGTVQPVPAPEIER